MGRLARTIDEIVDELFERAVPNGDCLICHLQPSIDRGGRKRHYIQVDGRYGNKWRVTRLVWHVRMGPIPEGLWVLHKCDNPACIKLDHLFVGTPQDNTQDMISKGRHKYISNKHNQKVDVVRLRNLRAQGLTYKQISEELNVSTTTVNNYFTGPYRDR